MILAFLVVCSCPVAADGGYVPKMAPEGDTQNLTEPTQRAVIAHFDGKQCMTLQVSFKGSASEFAWLIPTPSRPVLKRGHSKTFKIMHYATASPVQYWFDADSLVIESAFMARASSSGSKMSVEVLERKLVGDYDTTVLRAKSATDLLDWLHKHGYRVTGKLKPVIEDYLRKGWVFTAARINTASLQNNSKQKEGMLEPLQLQFSCKHPVYPLKISSINHGPTSITLYILTDHFVANPLLRTACRVRGDSNRRGRFVSSSGLQHSYEMQIEPAMGSQRPKYHVTKLVAEFEPDQMNTDVVLLPAKSQREIMPAPVSPSLLENIGATVMVPLSWLFTFPFCMLPCICCVIMSAVRTRHNDGKLWVVAFVTLLVGWAPMVFVLVLLKEVGFWPAGLLAVICLSALVIRQVRRRLKPIEQVSN